MVSRNVSVTYTEMDQRNDMRWDEIRLDEMR